MMNGGRMAKEDNCIKSGKHSKDEEDYKTGEKGTGYAI